LAGSGPLLLFVAGQLADAGAGITAVLETIRGADYVAAAPFVARALAAPEYLKKRLAMRAPLRRAGGSGIAGLHNFAIEASGAAHTVTYIRRGRRETVTADLVLLHMGVVPNTQITRQVDCTHDWHEPQRYWRPRTDAWGRTSIESIFVAGDGAAIHGALAAGYSGRLSALEIAHVLGRLGKEERDLAAKPIRRRYAHHVAPRPLLDALFRPAREIIAPADDEVLACRCEEVTVGAIRKAVTLGCL